MMATCCRPAAMRSRPAVVTPVLRGRRLVLRGSRLVLRGRRLVLRGIQRRLFLRGRRLVLGGRRDLSLGGGDSSRMARLRSAPAPCRPPRANSTTKERAAPPWNDQRDEGSTSAAKDRPAPPRIDQHHEGSVRAARNRPGRTDRSCVVCPAARGIRFLSAPATTSTTRRPMRRPSVERRSMRGHPVERRPMRRRPVRR